MAGDDGRRRQDAAVADCHGAGLRGDAEAPPIVGRSPSCVFRQLHDIGHGARSGERVQPMQATAALTIDDLLAIAAHLAAAGVR